MEFNGRIRNVMPLRSGTSQRGNEWRALPFVFEYKEVDTDPYPDSAVLEIFDEKVIDGILSCCQKDAQGNPIVQNDEYILTRDIYVRVGFRHRARLFVPKEGGPSRFINDIRPNNIVSIKPQQQAPQPQFGQQTGNNQAGAPFPPPQQQGAAEEHDDLPF